jgi:DNA invertase Pin-like site-specific DNA recombinase
LLIERTKAGMAEARRRGRHLGRPPALTGVQIDHARQQIAQGETTLAGKAAVLRVDLSTLRRALLRHRPTAIVSSAFHETKQSLL